MAKFFLHIDQKTQLERFKARENEPVQEATRSAPTTGATAKKWKEYEKAIEEMFDRTHRPDAPWVLIPANDKHHARLEVLRVCADVMASTLEGRR